VIKKKWRGIKNIFAHFFFFFFFFKQCTIEIQSVHNSCMKISLQVPEVARPRAFRLKDHPSVIIFRDRSVLRDEERKREVSARYAVEAKRREEKRSKEKRPVEGSRTTLSQGTSEWTGIASAAIARSVSLASVSAWL